MEPMAHYALPLSSAAEATVNGRIEGCRPISTCRLPPALQSKRPRQLMLPDVENRSVRGRPSPGKSTVVLAPRRQSSAPSPTKKHAAALTPKRESSANATTEPLRGKESSAPSPTKKY